MWWLVAWLRRFSTASGLLLVIVVLSPTTSIKKFISPNASEANELLVARIAVLIAVVISAYLGINPPGFVGEVVALCLRFGCSELLPQAIVLGIFDKRTNRTGAVTRDDRWSGFTAFYIITTAPGIGIKWSPWLFGISPQGIGTIGMLMNFIITYVVSRMTEEPSQEMQDFVESIRYPKGAGGASAHD
ncbi:MAG: hypothetical protein R2865_02740 [Deinococcales bacterium]